MNNHFRFRGDLEMVHPSYFIGKERWKALYDLLRQLKYSMALLLPLTMKQAFSLPHLLLVKVEDLAVSKPRYLFDSRALERARRIINGNMVRVAFLYASVKGRTKDNHIAIRNILKRHSSYRDFLPMAVVSVKPYGFKLSTYNGLSYTHEDFEITKYLMSKREVNIKATIKDLATSYNRLEGWRYEGVQVE